MGYGKGQVKDLPFVAALVTMLPCTVFTPSQIAMYKTSS